MNKEDERFKTLNYYEQYGYFGGEFLTAKYWMRKGNKENDYTPVYDDEYKAWFDNGQINIHTIYENGKRIEMDVWYKNGQKKLSLRNDMVHEWTEDGKQEV
ncbi:MAG: hypothetical protein B6229_03285 [Spirochaetaceae bacterium 4572_7]|nr:MAG: hypothetical protein B6229_03285 [Spirochaetaceae bacterium 4572_7]